MLSLRTLFFLALVQHSLASLTPSHIGGVYTLQHGDCPNKITILVNATTIPASTVLTDNHTCSGSTINLFQPTDSDKDFAPFLSHKDQLGEFYSAFIKNLTCGNATVDSKAFFLSPDKDFSLPQNALSFSPDLNETFPNGIVLSNEYVYIIVDACIFRKKAPQESGILDNIVNSISECLPADAVIHTSDGQIPIEKLSTGTAVLSSKSLYTPIIGWTHRDRNKLSRFVEISFENKTIAVTPGHYVYADGSTIPARKVKPGMLMEGLHGALFVRHVSLVSKRGLFNPQTATGNIVVDGIIITTYTEAVPPPVAHALLAPVRVAFSLFARLLGIIDAK